jgi:hypothetical protein
MEGNVEYLQSLSESLAEYRISLEKVLPEIKETSISWAVFTPTSRISLSKKALWLTTLPVRKENFRHKTHSG